jgi:hypothetical protein
MCGFPSCLFFMTCDLQTGCGDFDSEGDERRRRRPRPSLLRPGGPGKPRPAARPPGMLAAGAAAPPCWGREKWRVTD